MSELLRQAELHHIGGGRRTCTADLLVMSQASCCCSIPQVVTQGVEPRMRFLGCFTGSCSTVERDHRVWIIGDLNPAPPACKAGALPVELIPLWLSGEELNLRPPPYQSGALNQLSYRTAAPRAGLEPASPP